MAGKLDLELMRHEVRQTTQHFSRKSGKPIRVVWGPAPATNMNDIVTLPDIDESKLTPEGIKAIRGYVDHEAGGHLVFTDPSVFERFEGKPGLKRYWNCLEDPRIEKLHCEDFPGALKNLRSTVSLVTREFTLKAFAQEPVTPENITRYGAVLASLVGRKMWGLVVPEIDEAIGHFPAKIVEICERYCARALAAANSHEVADIAEEYMKAIIAEEEAAKQQQQQKQKQKAKSKAKSKAKQENDDGNPMEDTGTGGGDASDDADDNEGAPGQSSSSQGDEDSEEDESGSGAGDEDDEPSDGQAGRGEKDDDEAGEEGSGGAGSDEDEEEEQSEEGAGEDEEDDQDGADHDDEDIGAGHHHGGQGDDGSDGDTHPAAGAGGHAYVLSGDLDQFLDELQRSGPVRVTADERINVLLREKDEAPSDMVCGVQHKMWLTEMQSLGRAGFQDQLRAVPSAAGNMTKTLLRLLAAKQMRDRNRGLPEGRLDSRRLTQAAMGETNVFYKPAQRVDLDTFVEVLVDCSDSMNAIGALLGVALAAMGSALEATGVKWACHTFSGQGAKGQNHGGAVGQKYGSDKDSCRVSEAAAEARRLIQKLRDEGKQAQPEGDFGATVMFELKAADERLAQVSQRFAAVRVLIAGGTPTSKAILMVLPTILRRPESRKIMIILTDGSPNDQSSFNKVARELGPKGVTLVGIALGNGASTQGFPSAERISSVQDLAKTTLQAIWQDLK